MAGGDKTMTKTIDERVVSMRFDNGQFQSGVSNTLNSIDKLKSGLNFTGAAKGLESISASANKVSFSGLSSGIDAIQLKFSALQVVAVTALSNIANSAINAGTNIVKALTIDPVTEGFNEYENKLKAVKTMMSGTGESMDVVNKSLSDMNAYSDKTIYSFSDMTNNISKFTNAGLNSKDASTAIIGISNAAALAGATTEEASRAMYQLGQAMSGGFVGLMDWNSVENANMATTGFKNSILDTALAAGTLKKSSDGMYVTPKGTVISATKGFNLSLQEQWMTTEVLSKTLRDYGDETTEIGKKAFAAAQDVNSITQLYGTLKETVGGSWTTTWETIIGDAEQAKQLWTGVSNVVTPLIAGVGTARNKLLDGWADLGGRDVLINALSTAFGTLLNISKSLGSAFRDVFPATTSQQLFNFTNGLKSLAEHLKISEPNLSNLRSTFKGLFSILDIGKNVLSAVFKSIGILSGGVGDLLGSVLGITGSMGEWITAFDNTIKKSDIVSNVLTTLAWGIKNGLSSIAFVINAITSGVQKLYDKFRANVKLPGFETLSNVLGLMSKRFTSIGEESVNMATTVAGAFALMGKYIMESKMGELLSGIYDMFKTIGKGIGKLVSDLASTINNSIKNTNFSGILDFVTALSIGGMLLAFKKFMKSLKDVLGESKGFFSNVTGILDDVRGSFEAYQQNLKAGVLIKLGIAIALLAASIVAISLIDSEKLVSSLAAIGTLFAQLLVAMKLYSYIGSFKTQVVKSSIVMIAMATSILILAGAMTKLAKLDWNGIAKGLVGVAGLSGILVTTAKILSKGTKAMIKGALGMVVFAGAITILASACIMLSKLNWQQLTKGLVGVGILMAEISLFLKTAKMDSKLILTATGIVILATAMKILASACVDFGNMSWEEISKGLVSVGLLLAEISIFSKVTGNAKNVISTSASLILFGGAMKILASAMSDFGSMSWESIAKGLVAMGGALIEISIGMRLMPKDTIIISAGLVVFAAAMNLLVIALVKMGNMSWESIAKGLVAMGGSIAILAIGLYAMNGTLAGSAALLIAAGALALIAPALVLLGSMSWESIGKGLITLAGAIAIFGLSALILSPLIIPMLALGGAFVLLGVGMVGIGVGLLLVGLGLTALASGFTLLAGVTTVGATAIVASLSIIILGIVALIPEILAKIGEGIVAFIKVLADSIPAILECVTTIILAIIKCIVTNTPAILEGIASILISILKCIVDHTPEIINSFLQILSDLLAAVVKWVPVLLQQFVDLVISILQVISDNLPKFIKAGVDIIISFIEGIAESLVDIIDAAFKVIITFINGLADAIRDNSDAINDACYNLITAIVDSIGSFNDSMMEAGSYAVQGFINGLVSIPGKVWAAGKALGQSALDAAKAALDEHSPSREFAKVGVFSGMGLVNGLNSYSKKVGVAGYNMGSTAVKSVSKAISGISDIINSDMDTNPTIRPILDMSDVESGLGSMNRLFGPKQTVALADIGSIGISKIGNISTNSLVQNDNGGIINAIKDLKKSLNNKGGDQYNLGGITYDDGSNVSNAIKSLVRATRIERRI